jgi:prepilin-type N-terminal cleavage/methylation domain-containing protein
MKMPKGEEGFSLLEVLIAITILTVALLGLGLMQVTTISANRNSHQFGQASAFAEQVLEQMKASPFDAIATSAGIDNSTGAPNTGSLVGVDNTVVSGVTFYKVWNVTGTDPKQITVYVVWRDGIGTWHQIPMKTSRSSL